MNYVETALNSDEIPFHKLFSASCMPENDRNELFELLYEENTAKAGRTMRPGGYTFHEGNDFESAYDACFEVDDDSQTIYVDEDEFEQLKASWLSDYDNMDTPSLPHGPKINWIQPKRIGYGTAQAENYDKDELAVKRNTAKNGALLPFMAAGIIGGTSRKYNFSSPELDTALAVMGVGSALWSRVANGRAKKYGEEVEKKALEDLNDELGDYTVTSLDNIEPEEPDEEILEPRRETVEPIK